MDARKIFDSICVTIHRECHVRRIYDKFNSWIGLSDGGMGVPMVLHLVYFVLPSNICFKGIERFLLG